MSEKQQLTKVLKNWLSGWFSVFCGKTLLPLFCHPVVKFFHCFGNGFAGCRKVPRQRHIAEHKTLGGIGENVVNAVPTVINVIEHKEVERDSHCNGKQLGNVAVAVLYHEPCIA